MKSHLEVIVGRSLMAALILILFVYNSSILPEFLARNVIKNVEGYESFGRHNTVFFSIVMEKLLIENKNIRFILPTKEVKKQKRWYYRDWLMKRFTELPIMYDQGTAYAKGDWYLRESQFRRLKNMSVYKGISNNRRPLKFWVVKDENNLERSQNVLRFYAYKENVILVSDGLLGNN